MDTTSAWYTADCDGDGVPNGTEVDPNMDGTSGPDDTDPNDPCDYNPADVSLTPMEPWLSADCDGDGDPNGTDPDPLDPCVFTAGSVGDITNPIYAAADCDGDGETNDTDPDPNDPCVGGDLANVDLMDTTSDWYVADCDGDGVINGTEVDPQGDGSPGQDGTDPYDPCDFNMDDITVTQTGDWLVADCDGDGVTNGDEMNDGTDPTDPCDFDAGSITGPQTGDWLVADCDGDGEDNGTETANGTDPEDPCDGGSLANVDLMDTTSDWYVADCDGDGVINGTEVDPDMTGTPGPDNTDPYDPCDFNEVDITVMQSGDWLLADCDGDGVTNEDEVNSGTDPLDPCDYISTDITLPITTTVVCRPELEVTKTAVTSGENVGDTITFTIEVENTGNVVLNDLDIIDTFTDVTGNMLTLTTGPLYVDSTLGSPEGTIIPEEIAIYTATYIITPEAINAGGVSNTVEASAIATNDGVIVQDISDDGDDLDGNNSDDPTVIALGCLTIFNEFSPNGDGVNETFVINCIDQFPNNKLEIYNRWGNIVYSMNGYNNTFDGRSNGRSVINAEDKLPVGTYYYVLNLGDGSEPRVGWLYINR